MLFTILLVLHVLGAVALVGGSLFIWLVAVPASQSLPLSEAKRAQVVGLLGRRFGPVAIGALAILILSGLGMAVLLLGSLSALFTTALGAWLLVKGTLVVVLIILLVLHNVVLAPRLMRLARTGRTTELERLRRWSRPVAYAGVAVMLALVVMGVLFRSSW